MIVERPKHMIERSEKNSFDPSAGPCIALDEPTEIVHVNVPIRQRFLKGEVHRIDGMLAVGINGMSSGAVSEMVSKR